MSEGDITRLTAACKHTSSTVKALLPANMCHNVSSEHCLLCCQNNSYDVQYSHGAMLLSE